MWLVWLLDCHLVQGGREEPGIYSIGQQCQAACLQSAGIMSRPRLLACCSFCRALHVLSVGNMRVDAKRICLSSSSHGLRIRTPRLVYKVCGLYASLTVTWFWASAKNQASTASASNVRPPAFKALGYCLGPVYWRAAASVGPCTCFPWAICVLMPSVSVCRLRRTDCIRTPRLVYKVCGL